MKIVPVHVYPRGTRDICCEPFESFGFLWVGGSLCWNIPSKSQQQGMSSTEANELVAASASQKKIWISWKDKTEGTDRRQEERKPVQTKLRKYMISFFPIFSRFATQTFDRGWYCGVVTKIEFKTKVQNYKHNWWLQKLTQVKEPKITTWPWLIKRPIIFPTDTV